MSVLDTTPAQSIADAMRRDARDTFATRSRCWSDVKVNGVWQQATPFTRVGVAWK